MPQAKKPGAAGARKRPAGDAAPPSLTPVPTRPEEVAANFAILRDRLVSSITLTTDRLQDTVDDAVRRGRMTRKDAEDLLTALISAGRAQSEALLADLEQLLGRGPGMRIRTAEHAETVRRTVDAARRRVARGGGEAAEPEAAKPAETETRKPAPKAAPKPPAPKESAPEPATSEAAAPKRASRGGFPIEGYDDLTAAEIAKRVKDLTPAQLRKVRDREQAGRARKSVLAAVDRKLG